MFVSSSLDVTSAFCMELSVYAIWLGRLVLCSVIFQMFMASEKSSYKMSTVWNIGNKVSDKNQL